MMSPTDTGAENTRSDYFPNGAVFYSIEFELPDLPRYLGPLYLIIMGLRLKVQNHRHKLKLAAMFNTQSPSYHRRAMFPKSGFLAMAMKRRME